MSSLYQIEKFYNDNYDNAHNLPVLSTVRQKILEEGNRHKEKERVIASTNTNTQHAFIIKTSQREKTKLRKDVKSKFKYKCFNCIAR